MACARLCPCRDRADAVRPYSTNQINMPYRYLDDIATADVAFSARGENIEEMFTAAGTALLNVLVDNPESVEPREELAITLEAEALDLLLFAFLQEFVFYKDARRLLLTTATLTVSCDDAACRLNAVLAGETIDPLRHHLGVDVKAVTLHRFRVEETPSGWEATVILDV
jgi:protein archease